MWKENRQEQGLKTTCFAFGLEAWVRWRRQSLTPMKKPEIGFGILNLLLLGSSGSSYDSLGLSLCFFLLLFAFKLSRHYPLYFRPALGFFCSTFARCSFFFLCSCSVFLQLLAQPKPSSLFLLLSLSFCWFPQTKTSPLRLLLQCNSHLQTLHPTAPKEPLFFCSAVPLVFPFLFS